MKRKGFTLIELLVSIAVLAIVSGMALPSFINIKNSLSSQATKSQWVQFLNYARSSAVMNSTYVTACPLLNGECVDDLNLTWVLFTDHNKNRLLDADEEEIRVLTPTSDTRFRIYPANRAYFTFKPESSGIYSGTLKSISICPSGKADRYSHHLTLNINGRVRAVIERSDKNIPLRNGSEIVCS